MDTTTDFVINTVNQELSASRIKKVYKEMQGSIVSTKRMHTYLVQEDVELFVEVNTNPNLTIATLAKRDIEIDYVSKIAEISIDETGKILLSIRKDEFMARCWEHETMAFFAAIKQSINENTIISTYLD